MKKAIIFFLALAFPVFMGVKARADGKNAIFQLQSFSGILTKSFTAVPPGIPITVSNYDDFTASITFQPHGSTSKATILVPPHVTNQTYYINVPASGVCNVTFQIIGGSPNGDYYDNQGHYVTWISPTQPNGMLITLDYSTNYSLTFT